MMRQFSSDDNVLYDHAIFFYPPRVGYLFLGLQLLIQKRMSVIEVNFRGPIMSLCESKIYIYVCVL